MTKLIWSIVSVVLTVLVFALPVTRNWIVTIYDYIILLNTSFFSVMPAWFNFIIGTLFIALMIALARSMRD